MVLVDKKILLGITGGIAAYKSAELIRLLKEQGADVQVIMTQSAQAFISPLTLQALSGHPVRIELFDPQAELGMGHIELARYADAILIAPASANVMAKLAHGLADDLLTTVCLASTAPIFIAPAMNQRMWHHAATQANCQRLIEYGIKFIGPESGVQACGDVGLGRLSTLDAIISALEKSLSPLEPHSGLKHKHIVITAGPTHEAIDPIRYLSNYSSGKMGFALASAAQAQGANVILISGPTQLTPPSGVHYQQVLSAHAMHQAVMTHIGNCDIFIAAAAVADYRVEEIAQKKIKKHDEELILRLRRNPDILAEVAISSPSVFTVGFAAETDDVLNHAQQKLQQKRINMIIANEISADNPGFMVDENEVTVLWKNGCKQFTREHKSVLATKLINLIGDIYAQENTAKNSESAHR